jgi:Domain of unknown function (DUF4168)
MDGVFVVATDAQCIIVGSERPAVGRTLTRHFHAREGTEAGPELHFRSTVAISSGWLNFKQMRIEITRSSVVTWAFAALGAVWLAVAPAQTTQSPPGQPEALAPKSPTHPTDAELKSFAGAVVEVHRINDAYIPKFQAANTPDEEQKLEAAAVREMVQAVESEGLSVEKYEQILTQAQTDVELVHRLKRPLRDALSRVWT